MSVQFVKTHTLSGLIEASDIALERARSQGHFASLVVPTYTWAQQRKSQLRFSCATGVEIQTYRQWVSGLWELYGDGSTIIEPATRKVLIRPLITQVGLLQADPSPKLVADFGNFIEEAAAPGLAPSSNLSEQQAKIMELVSLYEHKLELEGHIELARAEHVLIQTGACVDSFFVFEKPDMNSAHVRSFVMGLGLASHVTLVTQELDLSESHVREGEEELASLHNRLFTGVGGVQPAGHVSAAEAYGAHVADELTAKLVRNVHEEHDIAYKDMILCPSNVANAYPRLFEELACADIPFIAQFSLPCARIALGAAFANAEALISAPEEESTYEYLVDLVCCPYSGLRPSDARALQMRWRERAHSTPQQRLEDLRNGFARGNATPEMMAERLKPLVNILDASREDRVHMLFENARLAQVSVDALIDDQAAAEGLLDYLELCQRYLCAPNIDEMTNLPITLTRSFGDPDQALSIISAKDLNLCSARAIILTELDAQHYPMAAQEGPFDALMKLLNIERPDTLAYDQRLMLLNCIEKSGTHFAFCRSVHDAAGDEICQSALFEEILAAYRPSEGIREGVEPRDVSKEAHPRLISMNESGAFFANKSGVDKDVQLVRGSLNYEWSQGNLLFDLQGKALPFSPTGLEDYYRCPYRWFASRRVGYNGMDNAFDAASQGNFVHAVMERFYKTLKNGGLERVTPQNLPRALEVASESFDIQLENEKNRSRGGLYLRTPRDEQECEELRKSVLDLVERDAEFLPDFIPTHFELTLGKGTGNMLEYAGVPVRGKVDRIDVDASGNAVIIDYKLSGLSAGYGFGAEETLPLRIQTDIYATLVQRHFEMLGTPIHVVGSIYRSYAKNFMRGVYARGIQWGDIEVRRDKNDALPNPDHAETYDEHIVSVENKVAECLQSLHAGYIAPNPIASGVCEYCKALSFCPKGGV